jgi:hypothetical protein
MPAHGQGAGGQAMGTHATIVDASSPAQIAKATVTVNQALGLRIGLDALWKLYYALASNASAAQPEGRLHVGSDDETGQRLASRAAYPSSLARSALRRQTPEVRAGCSNRACPDLCGGCPVMGIPTAILGPQLAILLT